MTRDDADLYGIDLNDPDMHEPRRCRHLQGDPNCDCHPEVEDEEPETEIDPDEQLDRDLVFAFAWIRQYRAAVPPEVTEEQVSEKDLRDRLNETRRRVEEIIESLQSDWIPEKWVQEGKP